jgi:hypothetical protein
MVGIKPAGEGYPIYQRQYLFVEDKFTAWEPVWTPVQPETASFTSVLW